VWAWNIHRRGGGGGGGGNESQDPINVLFLWVFAGVLGDVYLLGVWFGFFLSLTQIQKNEGIFYVLCLCVCVCVCGCGDLGSNFFPRTHFVSSMSFAYGALGLGRTEGKIQNSGFWRETQLLFSYQKQHV
jgi:hypothetical protein